MDKNREVFVRSTFRSDSFVEPACVIRVGSGRVERSTPEIRGAEERGAEENRWPWAPTVRPTKGTDNNAPVPGLESLPAHSIRDPSSSLAYIGRRRKHSIHVSGRATDDDA
ncbi:hypothetical protein K0M31_009675 [Melipona bicolor]|uniref:Uncharacterized protein n=1 Tax=Melipona bicolor TaxID=60889 RepID=A0AA40FPJ1_9HYME|nr:hypothetical protein K0M31_009675 [Melipona bicolor]